MSSTKDNAPKSVFKATSAAAEGAVKTPTSYQFWKGATKPQRLLQAPVDIIFRPSATIQTYGFFTYLFRFNIKDTDPRYAECDEIITACLEHGWELQCFYDPKEQGLTNLCFNARRKVDWEDKVQFVRVAWQR